MPSPPLLLSVWPVMLEAVFVSVTNPLRGGVWLTDGNTSVIGMNHGKNDSEECLCIR